MYFVVISWSKIFLKITDFMQPESSLLCSQEPESCSHNKAHEYSQYPSTVGVYNNTFNSILPYINMSPKWSLSSRTFHYNFVCICHLSHAKYLRHTFRPPSFHYPNYIRWVVPIMALVIVNFSRHLSLPVSYRPILSSQTLSISNAFLHVITIMVAVVIMMMMCSARSCRF
jgi:hypothetical protein